MTSLVLLQEHATKDDFVFDATNLESGREAVIVIQYEIKLLVLMLQSNQGRSSYGNGEKKGRVYMRFSPSFEEH